MKCHLDYPALPADSRRFPWRGARLGARSVCPVFLADSEEPSSPAVPACCGMVIGPREVDRCKSRSIKTDDKQAVSRRLV
jgi:hypothetical protein